MAAMESRRSNHRGDRRVSAMAGRIVTTGLHDRWLMHAEFRLWYSAVVRSRCCVYNIVALGKNGTIRDAVRTALGLRRRQIGGRTSGLDGRSQMTQVTNDLVATTTAFSMYEFSGAQKARDEHAALFSAVFGCHDRDADLFGAFSATTRPRRARHRKRQLSGRQHTACHHAARCTYARRRVPSQRVRRRPQGKRRQGRHAARRSMPSPARSATA